METVRINGYDLKDKKAIRTYDTVALMKADRNLKEGQHVKTRGYYYINDGGKVEYYITNTYSQNDIQENLENGLYANLIIENNTIDIRQLGARSQDKENNKYDIKEYINKYINYISKTTNRCKLYIPAGIWYTTQINITNKNGFDIYGDYGFSDFDYANSTIITSLNNNQDKIMNIGSTNNIIKNFRLSNIIFSTKDFISNEESGFAYGSHKQINDQVLNLLYCSYGKLDNIFFQGVDGQCLKISSCWELSSNNLNFRGILNDEGSILCFGQRDTTLVEYANISACRFDYLMFEAIHGDLIEFENDSNFTNNHIGVINFEDSELPSTDSTYTVFNDENIATFDEETAVHYYIFKNIGGIQATVVDSIELNNFSYRYRTKNEVNYVYDSIIGILQNNIKSNMIINNISVSGMNKDARIIKQNNYYPKRDNKFVLNNVVNTSQKDFYFDFNGYNNLENKAELDGVHLDETYNTWKLIKLSGVTSFNEIVRKVNHQNYRGYLFYDKDSQAKDNLVVKPYNTSTTYGDVCCNTVVSGTNMLIRAKIPNGETFRLALITSNHTTPFDMQGTGNYEIYTLDISALTVGDVVNMRAGNNSIDVDCSLDYFKFY